MPTWRSSRKSEEEYTLDYERLHDKLVERFGGDWIIAVRLHPNVKDRIRTPLDYVRDATDYPDMQDLLYTADMLMPILPPVSRLFIYTNPASCIATI